jgi:hypothetical protein
MEDPELPLLLFPSYLLPWPFLKQSLKLISEALDYGEKKVTNPFFEGLEKLSVFLKSPAISGTQLNL